MKPKTYRDPDEACANSRFKRAVGRLGRIRHNGKEIPVEVVKYLGVDGYIVFQGTHFRLRDATTKEVGQVAKWRPW